MKKSKIKADAAKIRRLKRAEEIREIQRGIDALREELKRELEKNRD